MKKKKQIPENFGGEIAGHFFDLSGCGPSNSIYNFFIEFPKEIGNRDKGIKDTKAYIQREYNLEKSAVDDISSHFLDAFSNIMLAIGFTLGQGFEINNPKAKREMDYIWQRMKERNLFFVYPHKKAA